MRAISNHGARFHCGAEKLRLLIQLDSLSMWLCQRNNQQRDSTCMEPCHSACRTRIVISEKSLDECTPHGRAPIQYDVASYYIICTLLQKHVYAGCIIKLRANNSIFSIHENGFAQTNLKTSIGSYIPLTMCNPFVVPRDIISCG